MLYIAWKGSIEKRLIKLVVDGSSICAWKDTLIPWNRSMRPFVRFSAANVTMVQELSDEELVLWDKEKNRRNFISLISLAICSILSGRLIC
jgi:hypothetical protein